MAGISTSSVLMCLWVAFLYCLNEYLNLYCNKQQYINIYSWERRPDGGLMFNASPRSIVSLVDFSKGMVLLLFSLFFDPPPCHMFTLSGNRQVISGSSAVGFFVWHHVYTCFYTCLVGGGWHRQPPSPGRLLRSNVRRCSASRRSRRCWRRCGTAATCSGWRPWARPGRPLCD